VKSDERENTNNVDKCVPDNISSPIVLAESSANTRSYPDKLHMTLFETATEFPASEVMAPLIVDELRNDDEEYEEPEVEDCEVLSTTQDKPHALLHPRQFRFTPQQWDTLDLEHRTNPHTTQDRSLKIANLIGCKELQVTVWAWKNLPMHLTLLP
jgi:hypothetical protein